MDPKSQGGMPKALRSQVAFAKTSFPTLSPESGTNTIPHVDNTSSAGRLDAPQILRMHFSYNALVMQCSHCLAALTQTLRHRDEAEKQRPQDSMTPRIALIIVGCLSAIPSLGCYIIWKNQPAKLRERPRRRDEGSLASADQNARSGALGSYL